MTATQRRTLLGLALAAWMPVIAGGCGNSGAPTSDRIEIGAYSVVREVFHDGLLPAFAAHWKKETGRDVQFEESYNASGAQARAIASGFDADLAVLSHSGDMETLVKAGRVSSNWNAGPDKGILTRSLVVIGHRPGNPKTIAGWPDLAKPGVGVLYPDPKTSGGARWNINAIYGSALLASKKDGGEGDEKAAADLLEKVQANVVNMDPSGRQSVANFERGNGDALVTYENELLLRKKEGKEISFIVPESTLVIESPVALVDSSLEKHGNRKVAEAFLAFLNSPEARAILAEYGFRPPTGEAPPTFAPLPDGAFTMADLGGWAAVEKKLYTDNGLWTSIFAKQAGSGGNGR